MVERVLENTVAMVRSRGQMYKAVAQLVLFCGSKIWVVMGGIIKVLEGFNHQSARHITGLTMKCRVGGEWEYPLLVQAMEAVGIHPRGDYIKRRQETIAERVAYLPIYELCTEADHIPGKSRMLWWWYQYAVKEPEEQTRIQCNCT